MGIESNNGQALFDKVVGILTPYIGLATSRASVKMFLKEQGVKAEGLHPEHLDILATRLEPGLRVFVGGATARMLRLRVSDAAKEKENP